MKKLYILIILIIGGLLYYTNPNVIQHREVIRNTMLEAKTAHHYSGVSALAGGREKKFRAEIADMILSQAVSVDDYKLFSLTRITGDGVTGIAGVGIMGKVYLRSDFKREIKQIF